MMQSLLQSLLDVLLLTGMVVIEGVSAHFFPNASALLNLPLIVLLYMTLTQADLPWILFPGSAGRPAAGQSGCPPSGTQRILQSVGMHPGLPGQRHDCDGRLIMRTSVLGLSFLVSGFLSWVLRLHSWTGTRASCSTSC